MIDINIYNKCKILFPCHLRRGDIYNQLKPDDDYVSLDIILNNKNTECELYGDDYHYLFLKINNDNLSMYIYNGKYEVSNITFIPGSKSSIPFDIEIIDKFLDKNNETIFKIKPCKIGKSNMNIYRSR